MVRFWASGFPAVLLFAFGIVWTAAMILPPRAGEPVAAIFAPTRSASQALAGVLDAGADAVIGVGALDTIVVAVSTDIHFVERLTTAGALVVIRAPLAGYCKT